MKFAYTILLFVFTSVACLAQTGTPIKDTVKANGALFHFEEPDLYDFGDITEGKSVVHEFTFTNAGTQPLIITDAMASCGCTTPIWPNEPVMPGKKGKIIVTYHSAGHAGAFIKNIFITSNAITPGESYVLHIKGNVTPRSTDKNQQ